MTQTEIEQEELKCEDVYMEKLKSDDLCQDEYNHNIQDNNNNHIILCNRNLLIEKDNDWDDDMYRMDPEDFYDVIDYYNHYKHYKQVYG